MAIMLFANNAASTLASPIDIVTTTIQLVPGGGSVFPSPASNQYFIMTLVDAATGLENEVVWVTTRAGDILTVVRGREGTVAQAWQAGDFARQLPTAGTMQAFSQVEQTQAGFPNYSIDTGVANGYVAAFTPAISSRIPGLALKIKAANANTGASTLNIGAGSFPLVNPDGSSLGAGAIVAGGIFEIADDGSNGPYQLISASQQAVSAAGVATTGDVKWRPTNEAIAGWVFANATAIGNAASNANGRANADCQNLFLWTWNNFSNTQCQLYTSAGVPTARGANALADWNANRQIGTIDLRGRGIFGTDNNNGQTTNRLINVKVQTGNVSVPGSILGENIHNLSNLELPLTNPSFTGNMLAMSFIGTFATINSTSSLPNFVSGTPFALGVAGGGDSIVALFPGSSNASIVLSSGGYTPQGVIPSVQPSGVVSGFGGSNSMNVLNEVMSGCWHNKL